MVDRQYELEITGLSVWEVLLRFVLLKLDHVAHQGVHLFKWKSRASPNKSKVLLSFRIGEGLENLPEKLNSRVVLIAVSVVSDGLEVLQVESGISNDLLL